MSSDQLKVLLTITCFFLVIAICCVFWFLSNNLKLLYINEDHTHAQIIYKTIDNWRFCIRKKQLHPHTYTHSLSINVTLHAQRVCEQSSFQSFSPITTILLASNQLLFERSLLLFPSTSKICPVNSSLPFTCGKRRNLLHLNSESRLFRFNWFRREFVLTRCSFLILVIHKSISLSLSFKRCLLNINSLSTDMLRKIHM